MHIPNFHGDLLQSPLQPQQFIFFKLVIKFYRKNTSEYHSIGDGNWTILIKHNCSWVIIIKDYNCIILSIEQNTITRGQLLYNIVLASATHQHQSATGIKYVSSLPPPSPPHSLGCHRTLSTWTILEILIFDKGNTDYGFKATGIKSPVLPFTSYVALRKLFHLSDPQIPQL